MQYNIQILLLILVTIICTPPPKVQPGYKIIIKEAPLAQSANQVSSNLRKLQDNPMQYVNYSQALINITQDDFIEHHILISGTKNVPDGASYPYYAFNLPKQDGVKFKLGSFSCKKRNLVDKTNSTCDAFFNEYANRYDFNCSCPYGNNEELILNYTYTLTRASSNILYRQEEVSIPGSYKGAYCDYKYVIPQNYKSLGLRDNKLRKENSCTFAYNGTCPDKDLVDVIRMSPRVTHWKVNVSHILTNHVPLNEDIILTILRMYKGGKLRNKNYNLTTYEGEELNDSAIITEIYKQEIKLPGHNNTVISSNLKTAFSNNLDNEFILDVPDEFYELATDIPDEIKKKVDEIVNDENSEYKDYPDYVKVGRFVHRHMTYNISKFGLEKTALEVYNERNGVCEHYTLLYNTMLNYLGYKTFSIVGYGMENGQTSANENTTGHAWSGVLINGTVKEFDSTWDLFEGISSAHVLKGFKEETAEVNSNSVDFAKDLNLQLIPNLDGEEENDKYIEPELLYNKTNDEIEEICEIYKEKPPEEKNDTILTDLPTIIYTVPRTTPPRITIPITQAPSRDDDGDGDQNPNNRNNHTINEDRFNLPLYFSNGLTLKIGKISICLYIISLLIL